MKSKIHLLPQSNSVQEQDVLAVAGDGRLIACDFKVAGVEAWQEKPWGYERGLMVNIDHHAYLPRMSTRISSTNLALLYVQHNGIARSEETVVINHTDCDSVLSAAIVRGDVEPLPVFGAAAIAADHTGEENAIADLLQGLDPHRDYSLEHYEYSLRCLHDLLDGRSLDERAQTALDARRRNRQRAAQCVADGRFSEKSGLFWASLDDAIEGEFFPALLPDAKVIVIFTPRPGEAGRWNVKFRLGNAAPEGLSLEQLVKPLDLGYGGRWNAGSNKRDGGTNETPETYAVLLIERMQQMA
jgi:hypothetical protein